MFKTLGIIMILISAVLISYIKADELKQKHENLIKLRQALIFIKNEISFSSCKVSDTCLKLSSVLSGEMAEIFGAISASLCENSGKSFCEIWKNAISSSPKILLSQNAKKIMSTFALGFGTMSKDIEIQNIEKTLYLIEEEIKNTSESYTKNRRLIFSLGGLFGISVMIILL